MFPFPLSRIALVVAPLAVAAGCASNAPMSSMSRSTAMAPTSTEARRPETVYAVTAANALVSFNAGAPGKVVSSTRLTGFAADETVAGIDFRPANGRLYAITSTGRLYVIDTASGAATRVGSTDAAAMMKSTTVGLNFNPAVDRIRYVGAGGENMRLHPDTGAVVDANPNQDGVQTDGPLAYAAGDPYSGRKPYVTGAAYTNSVSGAKTTTNFVIDANLGVLATQGSREGTPNPVSPNTGQLFTVGSLGVKVAGPVAFDIAPGTNAALATIVPLNGKTTLYELDLRSGAATMIGVVGSGEAVRAIAVAP